MGMNKNISQNVVLGYLKLKYEYSEFGKRKVPKG